MNKQEFWDAIIEKYPSFADDENVCKLKARGLRRLIEQAWQEGYDKRHDEQKKIEDIKQKLKDITDKFKAMTP